MQACLFSNMLYNIHFTHCISAKYTYISNGWYSLINIPHYESFCIILPDFVVGIHCL